MLILYLFVLFNNETTFAKNPLAEYIVQKKAELKPLIELIHYIEEHVEQIVPMSDILRLRIDAIKQKIVWGIRNIRNHEKASEGLDLLYDMLAVFISSHIFETIIALILPPLSLFFAKSAAITAILSLISALIMIPFFVDPICWTTMMLFLFSQKFRKLSNTYRKKITSFVSKIFKENTQTAQDMLSHIKNIQNIQVQETSDGNIFVTFNDINAVMTRKNNQLYLVSLNKKALYVDKESISQFLGNEVITALKFINKKPDAFILSKHQTEKVNNDTLFFQAHTICIRNLEL